MVFPLIRKLVAYRNNQVVARFWLWITKKGDSVHYRLVGQTPTFDKANGGSFLVDTTSILVEVTGAGIL